MRPISASIRRLTFVLTIAVMTATSAEAGTFTVNSRSEYKILRSKLQAVQFLARATFGFSEADVDALATRIRQLGHRKGLSWWIDQIRGTELLTLSSQASVI